MDRQRPSKARYAGSSPVVGTIRGLGKTLLKLTPINTRITQLVECFLDVEEVVSSSLAVSTIRIIAYS